MGDDMYQSEKFGITQYTTGLLPHTEFRPDQGRDRYRSLQTCEFGLKNAAVVV